MTILNTLNFNEIDKHRVDITEFRAKVTECVYLRELIFLGVKWFVFPLNLVDSRQFNEVLMMLFAL